jgi:diguanylate cyclase (GGDEF)-like protein
MSDVDYFKKYNDMYGHSAGDACLKAVGEALLKCVLRAGDFVVRYGGEEFVIILPYTDDSGACSVARQVLTQIRTLNIPHEKSLVTDHVTISVGITTISPTYTDKGKDYIKRADEALYLSKQKGRNRYTFLSYQ